MNNDNKEFTVIEATTKEQNKKANKTIKAGIITSAVGGLITAAGVYGCMNTNDGQVMTALLMYIVGPTMVSTVAIGMKAIAVGILEKLKVNNERTPIIQ